MKQSYLVSPKSTVRSHSMDVRVVTVKVETKSSMLPPVGQQQRIQQLSGSDFVDHPSNTMSNHGTIDVVHSHTIRKNKSSTISNHYRSMFFTNHFSRTTIRGLVLLVLFFISNIYQQISFVYGSGASYAITIEEPGDIQCFWIRVPKDRETSLSGDFDAWSEHEHMHVIAWIERETEFPEFVDADNAKNKANVNNNENSNNNNIEHDFSSNIVWQSQPTSQLSRFDIKVQIGGRYALCFESELQTKELRDKRKIQQRIMEEKVKQADGNEQLEQLAEYGGGGGSGSGSGADTSTDDAEEYYEEEVIVGFSIRVTSTALRSLASDELGPDAQRALTLMESIASIERNWENLKDHFDFLRNREALHFKLTEQINTRVIGWSIVEAVLVVTMAIGQVLYWRKFFEQRRYL